jgi:iron complex transport system ATP-binding protein
MMNSGVEIVVELSDVAVRRDGRWILAEQSLSIRPGEHWVVLGPNGAGKSTLLSLITAQTLPTTGLCRWLDGDGKRIDRRALRRTIATVSSAVAERLPASLTAFEVTLTGASNVLAPYWDAFTTSDRERVDQVLSGLGLGNKSAQNFLSLSQGERQKVLVARAMMSEPFLVVFDEAMAGLDLGAREDLLMSISELLQRPKAPLASVLVTHHLEEVPSTTTHVHLLRGGRMVSSGPISEVLTEGSLSQTFGRAISIVEVGGRRFGVASGTVV